MTENENLSAERLRDLWSAEVLRRKAAEVVVYMLTQVGVHDIGDIERVQQMAEKHLEWGNNG